MATIASSANFSGKNWGGTCQLTYTAGNGTINITAMSFKASSSTSASYGAYYDNQQNITVTAGGQSRSCTLKNVKINSTSYQGATFSGASFSGLSGNTSVSFTCRARSSSPYNLTFNYTIDAGSSIVAPTVSGLSATATNETTITASFSITSNGGAAATGHITCNGQTVNSTSATFTGLTAGQTYTITAYASNSVGTSSTLTASSQTYYYPHVTGCTSATIGQPISVNVYNPLGRTYTLQLISTNNSQVIGTYQGTSTNPTGFNTQTEINSMYASIPNSSSGQYRTKVTYGSWIHEWDSRGYGNYYVDASVCKPLFSSFTWADINATTLALTDDNSVVVIGYSNIEATIPVANKAEPQKSAGSIAKYVFECGGASPTDITYSSSADVSGTINNAPSNIFKVKAIDSRGIASDYVTLTAQNFIDYTPLSKTNASIHRVGEVSSQTTLEFEGQIDLENFGLVTNSITSVTYQYKTGNNQYVDGETIITPTVDANGTFTFTGLIKGDEPDGFNVENVYSVIVTVEDELSSISWELTIPSGKPHLAWHKDGISVMGKYDENRNDALQVNGNSNFKGNILKNGSNIFDLIYPIGSIYMSMNDTSPATLFGVGTWERISGGFLYGAVNSTGTGNGSGTSTGGNNGNTGSTTLTVDQIPSHTHTNAYGVVERSPGSSEYPNTSWDTGFKFGWNVDTGARGGGQGHTHTLNNHTHTIPYMAVYMWKRTA